MSTGGTNPFTQGLTKTAELKALRARGPGGPGLNNNSSHSGYNPQASSIISQAETSNTDKNVTNHQRYPSHAFPWDPVDKGEPSASFDTSTTSPSQLHSNEEPSESTKTGKVHVLLRRAKSQATSLFSQNKSLEKSDNSQGQSRKD